MNTNSTNESRFGYKIVRENIGHFQQLFSRISPSNQQNTIDSMRTIQQNDFFFEFPLSQPFRSFSSSNLCKAMLQYHTVFSDKNQTETEFKRTFRNVQKERIIEEKQPELDPQRSKEHSRFKSISKRPKSSLSLAPTRMPAPCVSQ